MVTVTNVHREVGLVISTMVNKFALSTYKTKPNRAKQQRFVKLMEESCHCRKMLKKMILFLLTQRPGMLLQKGKRFKIVLHNYALFEIIFL